MVKYSVKEQEKTVTCYLIIKEGSSTYKFVGVARCNPNDKWDPELGKKIAHARAILALKKAEVKGNKMMLEKYTPALEAYQKYHNALTYSKTRVQELQELINNLCNQE